MAYPSCAGGETRKKFPFRSFPFSLIHNKDFIILLLLVVCTIMCILLPSWLEPALLHSVHVVSSGIEVGAPQHFASSRCRVVCPGLQAQLRGDGDAAMGDAG